MTTAAPWYYPPSRPDPHRLGPLLDWSSCSPVRHSRWCPRRATACAPKRRHWARAAPVPAEGATLQATATLPADPSDPTSSERSRVGTNGAALLPSRCAGRGDFRSYGHHGTDDCALTPRQRNFRAGVLSSIVLVASRARSMRKSIYLSFCEHSVPRSSCRARKRSPVPSVSTARQDEQAFPSASACSIISAGLRFPFSRKMDDRPSRTRSFLHQPARRHFHPKRRSLPPQM